MSNVLLLNASEEIVNVISWQRAAKLLATGRAKEPYNFDDFYEVASGDKVHYIPSVIILTKFVRIPFSTATINRRNVMKRDGSKCQYCSKNLIDEDQTIDHVLPRSKGGKHVWTNIVACCRACNAKKADKTPAEAKMNLVRQPVVPTRQVLVMEVIRNIKKESWERFVFE